MSARGTGRWRSSRLRTERVVVSSSSGVSVSTRPACQSDPMRPSLYEFAGGAPALERLVEAHHARCLADPELNHPFSHSDGNPEHLPRLAAYWGEVLGGPPVYSQQY